MAVAKAYYDGRWSKAVRHALIDMDMGVNDLALEVGRTRVHVSQVINSRCYSKPTIIAICNILDILDPDTMDRVKQEEQEQKPEEHDDLYAVFEAMLQNQQRGESK